MHTYEGIRMGTTGADNHAISDLPIGTACAAMPTNAGDVLGTFHQHAISTADQAIHSSIQIEDNGHDANQKLFPQATAAQPCVHVQRTAARRPSS